MPVLPPADISVEQYLDLMLSDKKAESGKIRFVLLKIKFVLQKEENNDVIQQERNVIHNEK